TVHSGATTPTLSIGNATAAMHGTQYRCQVANTSSCAVASDTVKLSVYPGILYVNGNAPSGGDGRSWATAYRDLNQAISQTKVDLCGVNIWVAQGIYTPASAYRMR